MTTQPTLTEKLSALGQIDLHFTANNSYYDISTNLADDAHVHSCYELYVNVSGDVSFLHGSEIYDLQSGDVVISFPGEVHYCIYHSSCYHRHYCLWFDSEELGAFLVRQGLFGRIRSDEAVKERILALCEALSEREEDSFLRSAKIMELFSIIKPARRDETPRSVELPEKMADILRYVEENFVNISGSSELCEKFYISESTLNRMVRKYAGISLGALVEAKRLSYSEKLLRSDHSVTDACFLSGFSDLSRFIAKFKKKFGLTPLKYKQRFLPKIN